MNDVLAAIALLTIVPILREPDFSARAYRYFPLVGAGLGVVLAISFFVLRLVLPPLVTAALIVGLWALLTGGLHLDGVSDACDALFAATTRERRLEILRDVHVGSFGAAGLVLILLLKFAALTTVNGWVLLLAPVLARWAMVYAAAFPPARTEGMGALFARGLTRRELGLATLLALVLTLPFGWLGLGAWIAAVVVATAAARFAMARLGGLTGDIYGMICECVEVGVLVVGVAVLPSFG